MSEKLDNKKAKAEQILSMHMIGVKLTIMLLKKAYINSLVCLVELTFICALSIDMELN